MDNKHSLESDGPSRIRPKDKTVVVIGKPPRKELPFETEKRILGRLTGFLDNLLDKEDHWYTELSPEMFSDVVKDTQVLWDSLVRNGYIEIEEYDIPDVDSDQDGNVTLKGSSTRYFAKITDKFYKTSYPEDIRLPKEYDGIKDKIYEKLDSFTCQSLKNSKDKLLKILKDRIAVRFHKDSEKLFSSILLKTSIDRVLSPERVARDDYRLFCWMEGFRKEGFEGEEIDGVVYTTDIPDDIVSRDELLNEIINDIYYDLHRRETASWIGKAKNCDILVVNAPLGLGKSVAITSVLKKYKDKSAIIFLPTLKLCVETMERLSGEDCFFVKGITEESCKYFDKVKQRYYERLFSKRDICSSCDEKKHCPNLLQYAEARKHRIVVTTHRQYPRFLTKPDERTWGTENKVRDLFIIDENIIDAFLAPIEVPLGEFNTYIDVLTDNSIEFEYPIKPKLEEMRRRALKARKGTVIAPIDKDFNPTKGDMKKWDTLRLDLKKEKDKEKMIVLRNLREYFTWAMQHGFSVYMSKNKEEYVYMHDPVRYDWHEISNGGKNKIPTHVFFDAIDLDSKLISNYFPSARIKKHGIEVPSLWRLNIHHTDNQNLSRSSYKDKLEKRKKTKEYIEYIVDKHGKNNKYFVITTSDHEPYIVKDFSDLGIPKLDPNSRNKDEKGYLVICHYGNQRGINDAKYCNVGILLGTYYKSPEIIIASYLPYIQDRITNDIIVEPNIADFVKAGIKYQEEWPDLRSFDLWARSSEHEQGMGRTRHLYHDVDFYTVTKDPVQCYSIAKDMPYEPDPVGRKIFAEKGRHDSKDETDSQIEIVIRQSIKEGEIGEIISPKTVVSLLAKSGNPKMRFGLRRIEQWFERKRISGAIEKLKNGMYRFNDWLVT